MPVCVCQYTNCDFFLSVQLYFPVCITLVERFVKTLSKEQISNQKSIEEEFRKFCKTVKDDKEERFVSTYKKVPVYFGLILLFLY